MRRCLILGGLLCNLVVALAERRDGPIKETASRTECVIPNTSVERLKSAAKRHLSPNDFAQFEKATGYTIWSLLNDMRWKDEEISNKDKMNQIFSTERPIFHPLNDKGLHVFRALISERMTDARRKRMGSDRHPLFEKFDRDGILIIPLNKNTSYHEIHKINANLFPIITGYEFFGSVRLASSFDKVVSSPHDVQRYMHVDTFLPSWKFWIFRHTIMEHGPFHFVKGSHRNTLGKMQWLFQRTANLTKVEDVTFPHNDDNNEESDEQFPNVSTEEGIHHPTTSITDKRKSNKGPWHDSSHGFQSSIRMEGFDWAQPDAINKKLQSLGFHDPPTPILVPQDVALVIADTSALHFRGVAHNGYLRRSMRLNKYHVACSDDEGDLPRKSPFLCEHNPSLC